METQAGDSQSRFGASVWAPAALSSLDRQTSLRATASAALACGYCYRLALVGEECPCGRACRPARESPGPPSFPNPEVFRAPSCTASTCRLPGHASVLPLAAPDLLARLRLFYSWPAE